MFELIPYQKFRDTPSVRFFDITISESNARDLVFHEGPAVSPNNSPEGYWQFYLHPNQQDNLLALSGGRTFYLVNFFLGLSVSYCASRSQWRHSQTASGHLSPIGV